MNGVVRFLVYALGLTLVAVALWLLFFETGVAAWVPYGVLVAAVLLVVGLGVMAGSDRLRRGSP
ncbi:MAG TPA: hypothetical protein VI997_04170 [Candidatus Thermoplasmatota archaeon]|nr:hypothetical protein [Candidatus Thermoplasmatota archaeon]